MSRRRSFIAAAAVLVVLTACGGGDDDAAPSSSSSSEAASATVTVKTFQFAPDPIEVEAGTTITFENMDKINHSVTAGTRETPAPDEFEGVMDGAGTTYELTLDEPGTYDYFCKFHPGEGMTGQIVVS